jgi:hypothetical protein
MQNEEDESLEATPKPIYINLTIDINYFVQREPMYVNINVNNAK